MTEAPVPLAEQIAALQGCIEWSDHQVNLGIGYAPKENAALRAVLATLQQHERLTAGLADANERIARLEGALETAARFHGIDVDVLCEQRVATALEYPTPEQSEHPTSDAIVDGITEIVADRFKTIGTDNDLRFGAGVTVRDVVLLTVATYIELINRLRAKAPAEKPR